jgi:hypothetical protein
MVNARLMQVRVPAMRRCLHFALIGQVDRLGRKGARGRLGPALMRSGPAKVNPTLEKPNEPETRRSPGESEIMMR